MRPAHESGRNFDRLGELLREMFQLDRGDLDFGLYRVMRMKAGEVERFLNEDLLPQVKTVLAGVADEQRAALEAELERTIRSTRELGVDPENAPEVTKLREQVAQATADAEAEADVYGHLVNFFARYYREGDFISLRRYSSGGNPTYLIPYDGEEVKLHWANADQYYVKTTENYASYAFLAGEGDARFRVCFEIEAADNEKDNIKEANGRQRRFVLAEDAIVSEEGGLVVRFEHRPLTEYEKRKWPGNGSRQQGRINADTATSILVAVQRLAAERWQALAVLAPTDSDPERTLLARHVGRYTAKNSFDYFIHKDLGGFLRRELDLYLKTDVLDLQDLALGDTGRMRRALGRMRAVREIGDKLITFLAQLEDFQKRLWLKKKFVLETQWCVTLDRVPESFYPEIAANEAQWQEWQALFATGYIADGPERRREKGDFRPRQASFDLVADTGQSRRLRSPEFLCANPNLALDTRHFERDFKDRLLGALSDAGSLDEQTSGLLVHGENFQALNLLRARYGKKIQCIYVDPPYNTGSGDFVYKDRYQRSSWLSMMEERAKLARALLNNQGSFYCQIDHLETHRLREIFDRLFTFQREIIWDIQVLSGFKTIASNWIRGHETILFYTVSDTYLFNKLRQSHSEKYEKMFNRTDSGNRKFMIAHGKKRYWDDIKDRGKPIGDVWSDIMSFQQQPTAAERIGFSTQKPEKLLERTIRSATNRNDWVLDYFGGSGTTAACAQKLNRKYILCEVGEHFHSITLTRMKQTLFGKSTSVSRDSEYQGGGVFQYINLESYEDTLDGLVMTPPADGLLEENHPGLVEDYKLRYALDEETADSPCLLGRYFRDPFAYTLSVVRDGARRETPVDLPETFNLLLGLRVESRCRLDGVLAITGKDPEGRNCLVLWRNLDDTGSDALNDWFRRSRMKLPDALDLIYANGDHTLNAVRRTDETWRAAVIEPLFRGLMFEAVDC